MKNIIKFVKDESGATAIEYALIAVLVSVAIIGGITSLGSTLDSVFISVGSALSNA